MRETEAIWWSSISFASLWASSTGWTLVLKARPNAPSTSPPSFASRLRSMLISPRRVVLSRRDTRRPPRVPHRCRVEADEDHERRGDAARHGAARVVERQVRGERVTKRRVRGDERRGADAGAQRVHGEPTAADHDREHQRTGYPGRNG